MKDFMDKLNNLPKPLRSLFSLLRFTFLIACFKL